MNALGLKSEIVKAGYTQRSLCAEIGMAESTFISKVKNDSFKIKEVKDIARVLSIRDPYAIFFADQDTW